MARRQALYRAPLGAERGEHVGIDRKAGLAKGVLDQFDAAVAPLFERQLEQMGLSESQVEQQDLAQLRMTLEKINNAIDNSGSLMKFRVRLTAEAGAVITHGPDYHYEVSILPTLVTRKGRVLERITELTPDAASGPAPDLSSPPGSQQSRAGRDSFASGRDFTINNYFGTGQGSFTAADETAADPGAERNDAAGHPRADRQPSGQAAPPQPTTREPGSAAAQGEGARTPEVSMEAGIAYARIATQFGHPPHTATKGRSGPDQPLDYLLGKTAQTVWEAVSSAQPESGPYLAPLHNYLGALIAKIGVTPARDFALGVLTELVRQEEDGWPDQPGDPGGKRSAHGTGTSHLCLLERKHQVETAVYAVPTALAPDPF
jgi:hypothetical protein